MAGMARHSLGMQKLGVKMMNLANLFQHETDLQPLAAGETLFREGEKGDVMYVLMSGVAEIRVHGKVVEVAEAGALLGEMTMIDEAARSATVVARTDCKLLPIDRRRFDFLIQNTPHFALHVMRVIARRLRRTDAEL
jgi:CRP-like cAMP-binding protein